MHSEFGSGRLQKNLRCFLFLSFYLSHHHRCTHKTLSNPLFLYFFCYFYFSFSLRFSQFFTNGDNSSIYSQTLKLKTPRRIFKRGREKVKKRKCERGNEGSVRIANEWGEERERERKRKSKEITGKRMRLLECNTTRARVIVFFFSHFQLSLVFLVQKFSSQTVIPRLFGGFKFDTLYLFASLSLSLSLSVLSKNVDVYSVLTSAIITLKL